MTILEAAKVLNAVIEVEGEAANVDFRRVVASDLMSDVLLVDEEDVLLLTSLASDQVVRTAQIIGAVGVIVVNGKSLPSSIVGTARDLGITLGRCALAKYDACIAVHEALKGAER
jgi:hypothetical protein